MIGSSRQSLFRSGRIKHIQGPFQGRAGCRCSGRAAVVVSALDNLGELSRYTSTAQEDLSWAAQRVSPDSFANRGLYVDTPVVLASGLLLLMMFAISFQRILGLDKIVADFLLRQQDKRRQDLRDAKQKLEKSWSVDNQNDDSLN